MGDNVDTALDKHLHKSTPYMMSTYIRVDIVRVAFYIVVTLKN